MRAPAHPTDRTKKPKATSAAPWPGGRLANEATRRSRPANDPRLKNATRPCSRPDPAGALRWPFGPAQACGPTEERHGARPHRHHRRAPAQPEKRHRRDPQEEAGRADRRLRIGQVLARLRHALRRGPAALHREPLGLRAAVPGADGEAALRLDQGPGAHDLDRAEDGEHEPALDGRHGHRAARLPARALGAGGPAHLLPLRPRRLAAVGAADRARGDGARRRHEVPGARAARLGEEGRAPRRARAGAQGRLRPRARRRHRAGARGGDPPRQEEEALDRRRRRPPRSPSPASRSGSTTRSRPRCATARGSC